MSCPRCLGGVIGRDPETGEEVCFGCGYVVNERVPVLETYRGDGAVFDQALRSQTTIGVTPASSEDLWRMQTVDTWSKGNRSAGAMNAVLLEHCARLSVNGPVRARALQLYVRMSKKGTLRWFRGTGNSREVLACALLYAAMREAGTPRLLREVVRALGLKFWDVSLAYRKIVELTGLKVEPVSVPHLISRIVSTVGLGGEVEKRALGLADRAASSGLAVSPAVTASCCVYLAAKASGKKVSQKGVGEAVSVPEYSVGAAASKFKKELGLSEALLRSARM